MGPKPLRETCTARKDVLDGGLSDNHFAAQLDKIVRDPGNYPVYGEPDQFFAVTFPTSGLRTLLTKTFGRVTGAGGVAGENGVLRPETSFGGGKTHGLTAVYHLAQGARPAGLDQFVDTALLPDGPVQVAAIVGDALDPSAGLETNGVTTTTIWGEMAAQIGPEALAALENNERDRTAPGTHTILKAFAGRPTIVIVDELARHLRQAVKSGNQAIRDYAEQIPAFLKSLTEVAGDPGNRVVVILTLASQHNAFGKETDEIAELLDEVGDQMRATVSETQDALTRMVQATGVIRPAEDTEIGEILKRRLFTSIDEEAAAEAAEEYKTLYEQLVGEGEQITGGADNPGAYAEAIKASYPFHPELVRVLDKRLGAIPKFQRARGALKLLAEVVASIYRDGDDCDVINVADIDFTDEPIRNHLTVGLERPEYASVAEVDLAGPRSHAALVDARAFPGRTPYTVRICRTVLIHSLEQAVSAGAGRSEWLLGTLRPGDATTLLEKALTEAERTCWHLAFDGMRWRFQVEPNVTAILEEEKSKLLKTRVTRTLDDLVAKAFCNDGATLGVPYPSGPAALPDTNKLRIAVMDPEQVTVSGREAETAPNLLVTMLDTVGQSGSPRTYRNSLVFVVADADETDRLRDRVRSLMAAEELHGNETRMAQFTNDVRNKIDTYKMNAHLEARVAITRCFKHVYYPVNDKAHSHLRHHDLPPQHQGDTQSATSVVLELLEDEDKIRKEKPSYEWLRSKAWPANKSVVSTQDLLDWFWIDHGGPIVRNPAIIREAIVDGIKGDNWVYYDTASGHAYTGTTMAGLSVEFRNDAEIMTLAEATDRGLLVRKPTLTDLKGLVESKILTGAQLRQKLEARCGGEPTKGDVLDVLSTAVAQHKYDWLVVTGTDPAPGVRALTPTEITRTGLDGLRIMTRQQADTAGVDIPDRKVVRSRFTANGASGPALAAIADQVGDSATKQLTTLSVTATADETRGTGDIDLLVSALGMLQQYDITVTADLTAEFPGVDGQMEFVGTAARKDYQNLNATFSKLLVTAHSVGGSIRIVANFSTPIEVTSPDFIQLHNVLKTLNITNVDVAAEVTK